MRHTWTPAELALLGTAPDHVIAARIGLRNSAVAHRRKLLGVQPCGRHASSIQTDRSLRELLAARPGLTTREVAAALGWGVGRTLGRLNECRGLVRERLAVGKARTWRWSVRA